MGMEAHAKAVAGRVTNQCGLISSKGQKEGRERSVTINLLSFRGWLFYLKGVKFLCFTIKSIVNIGVSVCT